MKLRKQIKKGVTVEVIAGKDKGKSGKIIAVDWESNRVVVDGLNLYKKHQKPKKQGEKGQVVSVARSIHVSNVRLK